MHIAVAGNIGSGKTTLTGLLARHYGWEPHYESVDFNPYLVDFYNDMQRWSFNLQVYFLNKRLKDIVEFQNSGKNVIQDRTIYEDAMIFAPNLHDMGLMDTRDFENYASLFELMQRMVGYPDLLIYLRSSIPNLVAQIQKRGREYERVADNRRGHLPVRGQTGGFQPDLRPDRRPSVRALPIAGQTGSHRFHILMDRPTFSSPR